MEPVTHFLTGAVLARAGLNRKAAYTTLAMTLAAEAPDLDVFWSLRGPIAGFEHHRGITHTLLGLPFEAGLVLALVYGIHRWRLRRNPLMATRAPIRWPLLYAFSLIALLSHLLLDWTNTYGVRPFFPFNPRWYEGSIVFIVEPLILLLLALAFAAPALTGLIGSEVGARRQPFRGRGWAIFALLSIAALWTVRFVEHGRALQLAAAQDYNGNPILRIHASPYPFNPFQWHAVVETPAYYQLATVDTLAGTTATSEQADTFYKPPTTIATLIAKQTWLGEVYLDWSQYPLVTEKVSESTAPDADTPAPPPGTRLTEVTFRDLRFIYDVGPLHGRQHTALGGSVFINDDRKVVRQEFGDRPQP